MTDYSDYVHCGEVFKSTILSNKTPYIFKCIKCQDVFQLDTFIAHFEQKLCVINEICIKEEVLDCSEMESIESIKRNSVNKFEEDQLDCFNKNLSVKKVDVYYAGENGHDRCEIKSRAQADAGPHEFSADSDAEYASNLNDNNYNDEDVSDTGNYECLVERDQDSEEDSISKVPSSTTLFNNFINVECNVLALIEAYKAQMPLWNKMGYTEERRRNCLEIMTRELNQKRSINLHWSQVLALIVQLCRTYRDDLRKVEGAQKNKSNYKPLWFFQYMHFLQPIMEKNNLYTLDPHFPSLTHEEIVQICNIFEKLPHLWNTSLLEHRCNNKRCESEMEMIKEIESIVKYKIDSKTLNMYLSNIYFYFSQEKRKSQNGENIENSGLYQHLAFLLDHIGPFQCPQCEFESQTIFIHKIHLAQHNGSMPFKCSQCSVEFTKLHSYDIHVRRHLNICENTCKECGRKFLSLSLLEIHMKNHSNDRNCICKTCGKGFKMSKTLKAHERTHSDKMEYVCTICHKSFKCSDYLKQHNRRHTKTHSNIRDCICETCGKGFITTQILKRHMRTHLKKLNEDKTSHKTRL